MKYFLTAILLPILHITGTAAKAGVKPLTIGDKVPPFVIKNICNYPASASNITAFNDKLLLLDFMGTTCSGCIKVLPRFQSLQSRYAGSFQVLLVTYEKQDRVKAWLQNNRIGKTVSLPIAAEDSVLAQMFPHFYLSHQVWIKNGVVKAITEADYVTAANIKKLLDNEAVSWPVKRDLPDFDYSKPLFHINESVVPSFSYPPAFSYTAFTAYMPNVVTGFTNREDSVTGTLRLAMINASVLSMYRHVLNVLELPPSHMLLNVKDRDAILFSPDKSFRIEWMEKNTFCYEAIFPKSFPEAGITAKVLSDIASYTGVSGAMQKLSVECLVIKDDSVNNGAARLRRSLIKPDKHDKSKISMARLLDHLNLQYTGIPVINESGYTGIVIIDSDDYPTSMPVLSKALVQAGLSISKEQRTVDMLVLSDKKTNQ